MMDPTEAAADAIKRAEDAAGRPTFSWAEQAANNYQDGDLDLTMPAALVSIALSLEKIAALLQHEADLVQREREEPAPWKEER
jgi:hypothetical protein